MSTSQETLDWGVRELKGCAISFYSGDCPHLSVLRHRKPTNHQDNDSIDRVSTYCTTTIQFVWLDARTKMLHENQEVYNWSQEVFCFFLSLTQLCFLTFNIFPFSDPAWFFFHLPFFFCSLPVHGYCWHESHKKQQQQPPRHSLLNN